jgi:hypothetical protein
MLLIPQGRKGNIDPPSRGLKALASFAWRNGFSADEPRRFGDGGTRITDFPSNDRGGKRKGCRMGSLGGGNFVFPLYF